MKVICPIRPQNFEEFESLFSQIDNRADIIEVWVDRINDDFFKKFKKFKKGRIGYLAVCKQRQEKGEFEGSSADRVACLNKFLASGGDFVDLDVTQNDKMEIKKIKPEKLVLSFHDFSGVPDNLHDILTSMSEFDPAVYKFAVTVNSTNELDKFMNFINTFPLAQKAIFTTMGKMGTTGRQRIGKKSWGQFFALDKKSKTAEGQLTLDDVTLSRHCHSR